MKFYSSLLSYYSDQKALIYILNMKARYEKVTKFNDLYKNHEIKFKLTANQRILFSKITGN